MSPIPQATPAQSEMESYFHQQAFGPQRTANGLIQLDSQGRPIEVQEKPGEFLGRMGLIRLPQQRGLTGEQNVWQRMKRAFVG